MSNGATSTSPTADAASSSRSTLSPTRAALQAGPPIPNRATSSCSHRPMIDLHARVRDERPLRGRVVHQTGRHEPAGLPAECLRDAAIRLALRSRRPIAAAQRHDRDRDRRGGLVERRRHRRHGCAVTDPDRRAVADRPRSTSAASRPTIRRVRSSGPAIVGARWTASSPNRCSRVAAAGLSTAVRSTIRISTMPSARARLSSRETCGRVTPSRLAIAFCVSPSS